MSGGVQKHPAFFMLRHKDTHKTGGSNVRLESEADFFL